MDTVNTELIRGHVDTIILRTLQQGDRYPYDILKEISEATQGKYELKQATLYSCMKRLEKIGFIASYWGTESAGGRRKYYSLTDLGRQRLTEDQTEWEFSRTIINKLLSDKEFDLKKDEAPFDASALRPMTKRSHIDEDDEVLVSTPYMLHKDSSREDADAVPPANLMEFLQNVEEKEVIEEKQENKVKSSEDVAAAAEVKTPSLTIEESQQMAEASKLLQIGTYSQPFRWDTTTDTIMPSLEMTSQALPIREKEDDMYIKKLDDLFATSPSSTVIPKADKSDNNTSTVMFTDLKNSFLQQGFRLRLYSRPNAMSRQYLQYIYANRLLRDSYFILSSILVLLYVLTVVLKLYSSVAIQVVLGVCIALVPIVSTALFFINPNKRTRANYFFAYDAIIRSIIAILFAGTSIMVFIFTPAIDISFADFAMYMPLLFAACIPLYSVIKLALLNSKRYFVENK